MSNIFIRFFLNTPHFFYNFLHFGIFYSAKLYFYGGILIAYSIFLDKIQFSENLTRDFIPSNTKTNAIME